MQLVQAFWLRFRLRLRLGGGLGVFGPVHVATPGSVHGTFFELQLLIGLGLGLGQDGGLRLRLKLSLGFG